jgi:acyl carrier protein
MQARDIEIDIRDFVVNNFLFGKADGLTDSTSLLEKGIIDSTGVLELISFVQDHFDIKIEDSEVVPANLDSIQNLVRYISAKTGVRS